jgi:hypothetical protein
MLQDLYSAGARAISLDAISREQVKDFVADLVGKRLARPTIRIITANLCTVINHAIEAQQKTCTVCLRAAPGKPYYSHTTMANTVFEAASGAKEFFLSDFWKGPKPTPETIYRVHLVADERVFQVPADAVERWERNQGVREHV